MGAISPLHLAILLAVVLLVLGPRRLEETAAALGRSLREFRHGLEDESDPPPHEP